MILVYEKICQYCNNTFYKKYSHSQKYWDSAKYCSRKCSRAGLPNPRKTKPNEIIDFGDVIGMIMLMKHGSYISYLDKSSYTRKEIKNQQWSCLPEGYVYRRGKRNELTKHVSLHAIIAGANGGLQIHLGTFDSIEEAIKARIESEKKYWGHSYLEEKLKT